MASRRIHHRDGWLAHQHGGAADIREEIDEAVSDRPVFLLQTFNGPSVTSSAGKAFFEREPNAVVVADNGAIAGGMPSTTALFRLRQQQTLESKMRARSTPGDTPPDWA